MAAPEIEVKAILRLAKMEDFSHPTHIPGDRARNFGMQFWLINSSGQPESYRLNERTNFKEIQLFVEAERCYVLKSYTLS